MTKGSIKNRLELWKMAATETGTYLRILTIDKRRLTIQTCGKFNAEQRERYLKKVITQPKNPEDAWIDQKAHSAVARVIHLIVRENLQSLDKKESGTLISLKNQRVGAFIFQQYAVRRPDGTIGPIALSEKYVIRRRPLASNNKREQRDSNWLRNRRRVRLAKQLTISRQGKMEQHCSEQGYHKVQQQSDPPDQDEPSADNSDPEENLDLPAEEDEDITPIEDVIAQQSHNSLAKAIKAHYTLAKSHLKRITKGHGSRSAKVKDLIDQLIEDHAPKTVSQNLSIDATRALLEAPLYKNDHSRADVPFNNRHYNPTLAPTELNVCLVHAINDSLQGTFFKTAGDIMRRVDKAHRGKKHLLASLIANRGIKLETGEPLVLTHWHDQD